MANMTNTIAPVKQFSAYMTSDAVKDRINAVVGGRDGQRFITSIVSAVNANPNLAACDPNSIVTAALTGESLKLSPSPQLGYYYIIPYGNKATFQMGYRGYVQLAMRTGQYRRINVTPIKEGELTGYNRITEDMELTPILDGEKWREAKTVGYAGYFEYHNGFRKLMYWSMAEMVAHAKRYSQAYNSDLKYGKSNSFWTTDFDSMACKTLLRQLLSKWGIMSVEMVQAYEADNEEGVMPQPAQHQYIDNTEAEAEAEASKAVDGFFEAEPTNGKKGK